MVQKRVFIYNKSQKTKLHLTSYVSSSSLVRYARQVHQILLQSILIPRALRQPPDVLVLQNSQDQILIFVQVFLNQFRGDVFVVVVQVRVPGSRWG